MTTEEEERKIQMIKDLGYLAGENSRLRWENKALLDSLQKCREERQQVSERLSANLKYGG